MPHPDEVPNRLQAYGSTHREFLEDVDCELSAIMAKMAAETGMINPNAQNPMASADMDIQRTLAATSCRLRSMANKFHQCNANSSIQISARSRDATQTLSFRT